MNEQGACSKEFTLVKS